MFTKSMDHKSNKKIFQEPNDTLRGLLCKEDIAYLRKAIQYPDVMNFCQWVEKKLLKEILPDFRLEIFINDIKAGKIDPKDIHIFTKENESTLLNKRIDNVLKKLGNEKSIFFLSLFNLIFNREVLAFYRKIAQIIAPVLDIDIISISKTLRKHLENNRQKELLQALIELEFSYWSERYVTTWYENLSNSDKLMLNGVPVGPIVEYDLMTEIILNVPKP